MSTLTQAQFQWIYLNHAKDKEEENEKIKLISYIIDPQRAKAVFEPKPETEFAVASPDWFTEEVKKQSKMDPKTVEELLKTDPSALNDPSFTIIERQA
jgi:hypothetical protein